MSVKSQNKKIPLRKCIGCQGSFNKYDLLRLIEENGIITIDYSGKKNGRGSYLCKNFSCLKKAIKSKKIEKDFPSIDFEKSILFLEGELKNFE